MKATPRAWNPRYVNYARVHGKTPEAMLVYDEERWPGGKMCGYVLWNNARLYEFSGVRPEAFFDRSKRYGVGNVLVDREAYDAWLSALPAGHCIEDSSPTKKDTPCSG